MKGALGLRKPVATLRLDLSLTNVTTAAWAQLIAAMATAASAMEVVNNSASSMKISTGSAGNEDSFVVPYTIPPGGSTIISIFEIGKGARLSAKALNQNAVAGEFILNFFG